MIKSGVLEIILDINSVTSKLYRREKELLEFIDFWYFNPIYISLGPLIGEMLIWFCEKDVNLYSLHISCNLFAYGVIVFYIKKKMAVLFIDWKAYLSLVRGIYMQRNPILLTTLACHAGWFLWFSC